MTERRPILVVDDEEPIRHLLSVVLGRAGYDVVLAADGEQALARLEADEAISLVLCDVRMPRLDGLALLDRLAHKPLGSRAVHVIVMSSYGSVDLAIEAMQKGAYDYISKPFKNDEILLTLRKVEERERLVLENERLRAAMRLRGGMESFIGKSPLMLALLETARKIAPYPTTVLITGESGTGKERLARGLHQLSERAGPFVAVNVGAIPENLLESELFGHARGAFTGAVREHVGLFEQAHNGTILLDEIGELPLSLQVKLLRVLQEESVRRVGGGRELAVAVRVIAATSRDLSADVASGRFREDLFYRLDVMHLRVPSLRERREDIPLLVDHFIHRFNQRLEKRVRKVEPDVLQILQEAPWPGNVRQLENTVERAVLLCDGDTLRVADLPPQLLSDPDDPVEASAPRPGEEDLSVKRRTVELERELIRRALRQTAGNRSQAARLLELSYKALTYKIRDYRIEEDE